MKKTISIILCYVMIISPLITIIIDVPEVSALPGDDEAYIHSIDLLDDEHDSMLDKQLNVDRVYLLIIKANSTSGWSNTEIEVKAWYDGGKIGMASNYPAELESHRNAAFTFIYDPETGTAWVEFPAGDLEVKIINIRDTIPFTNSIDPEQAIHEVEIYFYIGAQLLAATGDNFQSDGSEYSSEKALGLDDPWSWDLKVTARDRNDHSVFNSTFGEFGIFINSNITVYGTPEAYGQPGESNIKMIGMSMLSYSANAVYWVNISCPDPQRKDGSGSIPISNLAVRLVHPNADGSNSEIAEEPTHFTGADIPMLVWNGNSMMPLGNGTWSSGPFLSDYNSPDNYSSYIEWWVDIPEGTSIGVYDWVITMTIECDSYKHEYPLYVNGIHVEDTSPPESNITEVIKASDHWTINAEANDNHSSVTEVVLMYRYSEDNVNWRSWTVYETDPTAPWSWDFDMLKHDGYYEFLSVAKDEYDNVEDAGLIADISETNGLGLDIYLIITIVIAVSIVAIVMVKLRKRKKE